MLSEGLLSHHNDLLSRVGPWLEAVQTGHRCLKERDVRLIDRCSHRVAGGGVVYVVYANVSKVSFIYGETRIVT